jgi:5-methylcytosine-specific restriction endonuclease McrA
MESATRTLVRTRARNCCEYCLLSQDSCSLTHHIEHVVPRQHGGTDDHSNLALACHRCNLRKGPNLTGIDPITGEIVPLFDPRRDRWFDHFRFRGPVIEGVTAVGRTTVKVLSMNDTRRIERRELLARESDG